MLLDTHVLLLFLNEDPQLTPGIKEIIENAENVIVSIITLWEIAIKLSIKKLNLQFEFHELPSFLKQLEIGVIPITFTDVQCYINLPLHHRDPFDRILIAQAINQSISLVSRDVAFDAYSIKRVWL
jgi:PIN domain nuclease of toxin-antitoxin system